MIEPVTHANNPASPFDLENETLYQKWRERKLQDYPQSLGDLLVEIKDPRQLTQTEHEALLVRIRKTNMALYAGKTGENPDRGIPHAISRQFGVQALDHNWLSDDDGLTSLTVVKEGIRNQYIPYSSRAINWHTDGYYNTLGKQIHTLNLHCVSPAEKGGENRIMDHEVAYILLRDENPDYIQALMAPDAMTLPARIDEGGTVARPDEPGPVYSIDHSGNLHMRYTIRVHNIIWKDDDITARAVTLLKELLESDSPYIYKGRLEPGMGLISNNILHDRTAFRDTADHTRLIYRARYYDRLANTDIFDIYPDL
ncbi:MAG TPA: taurine catabolism dioxygenase TauD [Acidiferrobacteraceae bacterium]|nr:taurine catabolism dioxygenase TauD [Acidiferrobacteraceae bacterium]